VKGRDLGAVEDDIGDTEPPGEGVAGRVKLGHHADAAQLRKTQTTLGAYQSAERLAFEILLRDPNK
jgi:hypothetical protein